MIVYQSIYVTVDWSEVQSLLVVQWSECTKKLTRELFFSEITHVHDIIDDKKPHFLLGDDTNFKFLIPVELQEGALKKTIARTNKIGLKKFAHIQSKEFIAALALEQTFEENKEKKYQDKLFNSIDDARKWLFQ